VMVIFSLYLMAGGAAGGPPVVCVDRSAPVGFAAARPLSG
jgi:hypothetical protein